jgi:hypothetical protein
MNPELFFLVTALRPALERVAVFLVANGTPPGLKVALGHVPVWTHAHQVLTSRLAQYTGAGALGAAGAGAALKKAALLRSVR